MSREIKFRAWDNVRNEMYNFVQITCCKDGSMSFDIGNSFSDLFTPKDAVLMQFTGLLDKNGKEIYEGDVMGFESYEGTRHKIRWSVQFNPIRGYKSWSSTKNDEVVLGNIYQDKYLLV